jgi:hypothetical protein
VDLASVDAGNCYNRIAHTMASMAFQSFGVPNKAIKSMLSIIPNMKVFLRMGYGNSSGYTGGEATDKEDPVKTQGMCQSNGASPAAWTITSIPMIAAQKKKDHGGHFIPPTSNLKGHLAIGLFVDDTDLINVNMREMETIVDMHSHLQDLVINWGKLLIATGGALNPSKCSYYLIFFQWKPDRM